MKSQIHSQLDTEFEILTIGTIVDAETFSTVATIVAVPVVVDEVNVVTPTPLVIVSELVPRVPRVVVKVAVVVAPWLFWSNTSTRIVA